MDPRKHRFLRRVGRRAIFSFFVSPSFVCFFPSLDLLHTSAQQHRHSPLSLSLPHREPHNSMILGRSTARKSSWAMFVGLLAMVSLPTLHAHLSMIYPLPRGHPLNPNAGAIDYDCRDAPLYGGCGKVEKAYPCGGYPPDKQIVQTFQAGQIVEVQFNNGDYGSPGQAALTPKSDQARHAGGLCEFSLSYDNGKTFGVFARYHGSCPDMYYKWPVKLPDNLPSCDSCLFAWTWIDATALRPEFYMSCADIKIIGNPAVTQPGLPAEIANTHLRVANMPGLLYYLASGDQFGNTKSNGPNPAELAANLKGATGGVDTVFQPIFQPNSPPPKGRRSIQKRHGKRRLR